MSAARVPDAAAPAPEAAAAPEHSSAFATFCAELADTLARPAERKRNLLRLAEALATLAGASVALCTPTTDGVLQYEVGTGDLAQLEGDVVPGEGTLEGEAFATREPRPSLNLRLDALSYLPLQRALPAAPGLAVPLLMAEGCAGVALFAASREVDVATLQLAGTLVGGALRSFREHERARASRAVVEALRSAQTRDSSAARGVLRAVRHELNTPVAVILGNLQLCASEDPKEWKLPAGELWQAIRGGAARLEDLSRLLRALDEGEAPITLDAQGRFIHPDGHGSMNGGTPR
ncbi:MAG TPA: histidine kinase dimerization/phospho-acceptor domain-containing protein [Longimicrobiaceae bacterium]